MISTSMKNLNSQSGFTLIEIIVATVIAGIMVISVTNLFLAVEVTQRRTRALASATRAGEQQIELLRNRHYNTLTPGDTIDFAATLPPELGEPRTATVEVSEPEPGLRELDLNITYRDGSANREVNLTTIIGSIGISQ